jgi:hypothetical protein
MLLLLVSCDGVNVDAVRCHLRLMLRLRRSAVLVVGSARWVRVFRLVRAFRWVRAVSLGGRARLVRWFCKARARDALAGRAGLQDGGECGNAAVCVGGVGCAIPSTSRWATTPEPGVRSFGRRVAVGGGPHPGTRRGRAVPGRRDGTPRHLVWVVGMLVALCGCRHVVTSCGWPTLVTLGGWRASSPRVGGPLWSPCVGGASGHLVWVVGRGRLGGWRSLVTLGGWRVSSPCVGGGGWGLVPFVGWWGT